MSNTPPAIILGSSDSSATPPAAAADTPIPLPTSDPGTSSSGTSSQAPAPVVTSSGAQDPSEILAPSAPGPSGSQPRSGEIVIPAEFGKGPFRNRYRHWCRRASDGRLIPIRPARYRQMMATQGRPVQPPVQPPHGSDDPSSTDASFEDTSSDESSDDEDPADVPIEAPSTPPKTWWKLEMKSDDGGVVKSKRIMLEMVIGRFVWKQKTVISFNGGSDGVWLLCQKVVTVVAGVAAKRFLD
ncbi:uncharacterized protein [Rutidosis leptorrhynchoides]|uniref:uncharacterized protein n=1 Tax=Rutidosis leptorrhynchoides TaxID=125765 RepID=UPI003A991997